MKYYFLSGLPRAGNTIISCILNQNKDIGVSANSLLPEVLYHLEEMKKTDVAFNNFRDEKSYHSMMAGIIPSYYSKWECQYIIDRSSWGTGYNLKLLKKYCPNEIKIVCLVRDAAEVFCSWIDWANHTPNNYLDRDTNNGSLEDKYRYLFHPHRQLVKTIVSVKNLMEVDPDGKMHILIDYNEFIDNPVEQLDRIYKFLDIPYYMHNLKHIDQFKSNGVKYNDNKLGKDMHKIRSNGVSKRKYNIEVPQHILDQCRTFNLWTTIIDK